MYKKRLEELKKENKQLKTDIASNLSAVRKMEKRLAAIDTEMKYIRALDAYSTSGKPLPKLVEKEIKAKAKKAGRKVGKRGGKGVVLTKAIPEVLKAGGGTLSTNDIIKALVAMGWKSSSSKPYPVVYNSAVNLQKKGILKKAGSGKFALK